MKHVAFQNLSVHFLFDLIQTLQLFPSYRPLKGRASEIP